MAYIAPVAGGQSLAVMSRLMQREELRLETFGDGFWPHASPRSADMATYGFFCLQRRDSDQVQCAYCYVSLVHWLPGHNVYGRHHHANPQCPFLNRIARRQYVPLGIPTLDVCGRGERRTTTMHRHALQGPDVEDELAVVLYRGPETPAYTTLRARLATFDSWPSYSPVAPEDLARAGFYYSGQEDRVVCFVCGDGACAWQPGDDPWEEHAYYNPQCPFVKFFKGLVYIRRIARTLDAKGYSITGVPPPPSTWGDDENGDPSVPSANGPLTLDQLTNEAMGWPVAEAYRKGNPDTPGHKVRLTVRRLLERTGRLTTVDAFCEALCSVSLEARLRLETATGGEAAETTTLSTTVDPPSGGDACKICFDRDVSVVCLPCGHLACCDECVFGSAACSFCRRPLAALVRPYVV